MPFRLEVQGDTRDEETALAIENATRAFAAKLRRIVADHPEALTVAGGFTGPTGEELDLMAPPASGASEDAVSISREDVYDVTDVLDGVTS